MTVSKMDSGLFVFNNTGKNSKNFWEWRMEFRALGVAVRKEAQRRSGVKYLRNASGPCHDHHDDPPKDASSPRKNGKRKKVVIVRARVKQIELMMRYPKPGTYDEIRAKKEKGHSIEVNAQTLASESVPALWLMDGNTFVGSAFTVSVPSPHHDSHVATRSTQPSLPPRSLVYFRSPLYPFFFNSSFSIT
ncbi:hypothetical protein CR513_56378, partial [Mucuna pruriens]